MHLDSNHHQEIHNSHRREAENKAIGFSIAIKLLRHREHLHSAVNQGCHGEESRAYHGYDQVTDIALWKWQAAAQQGDEAEKVGVFPLVWLGHSVVWHQTAVANGHLGGH